MPGDKLCVGHTLVQARCVPAQSGNQGMTQPLPLGVPLHIMVSLVSFLPVMVHCSALSGFSSAALWADCPVAVWTALACGVFVGLASAATG